MAGVRTFLILRFERTKSYVHQEDLFVGSHELLARCLRQRRRGTGTGGTVSEVEACFGVNRHKQVTSVSALVKKHRQAAFPLRQDMRARSQELQKALETPEPNPNAVGQLVIARRGLNKQLRALNVKLPSDIAALLTPEQQQKLEQLKERRNARRLRAYGSN